MTISESLNLKETRVIFAEHNSSSINQKYRLRLTFRSRFLKYFTFILIQAASKHKFTNKSFVIRRLQFKH